MNFVIGNEFFKNSNSILYEYTMQLDDDTHIHSHQRWTGKLEGRYIFRKPRTIFMGRTTLVKFKRLLKVLTM